jgi:hypothetical protein
MNHFRIMQETSRDIILMIEGKLTRDQVEERLRERRAQRDGAVHNPPPPQEKRAAEDDTEGY